MVLNECASGTKDVVFKIIRGSKFINCNVLLTSRPHTTSAVVTHFDTIVSVEGFTYNEARKFASRIVLNKYKVQRILSFNPGFSSLGEHERYFNVEDDMESGFRDRDADREIVEFGKNLQKERNLFPTWFLNPADKRFRSLGELERYLGIEDVMESGFRDRDADREIVELERMARNLRQDLAV